MTAEEFIREKIREKYELKGEMMGLSSYLCNATDCLRWAHEFAEFQVSCVSPIGWREFYPNLKETWPATYDKYLICRKDGKIHWETWNGTWWAYNGNVITHWAVIVKPE